MSKMAMHYIGGILKHARALTAFTNPGTNSYKRLVPGFEAPAVGSTVPFAFDASDVVWFDRGTGRAL